MLVKRIVANIYAADLAPLRRFYQDILGLDLVMDHGWIQTFAADAEMRVQLSVAAEGGSGTPVPDLSVEVDDVNEALRRVVEGGYAVEYGPVDEPWGVRRFYVRDPAGRLINILSHI
ncbi:VOC family protein [Pluralibacter gergoviae]|uniref:VOC family protein n=1 Tax=Pluralibacter gergoviae TaxID=61647 RepID=UPI000BFCDC6E|nr:VOC family protein [Pluralibacter gergoviae]MCK1067384.1 VOC family protein [Pluralibacter gergoviae]MCV7756577.1 VOC family protein [Pluralibacter gergoviae]PHH45945.1 glyoxalase [Pluralibacter gergoviae]HDS1235240.1 VOC family protein [Pluralibacter gergoviae]HDS1240565.1 VOC family protein [Pluralibacter gergoviae]